MSRKIGVIITREELFKAVWTKPVSRLASEYGLSDVGLGKICKRLEVPRPPRGYWRKLEVGKAPPKPELPVLTEGGIDHIVITPDDTEHKGAGITDEIEHISVPFQSGELHPLTKKTQSALLKGKADEKGLLRTRKKGLLSVEVTQENVDRACRVMDALVKALEGRSFAVNTEDEGDAKTVVMVDGEALHIGIEEKIKRVEHVPTEKEKTRAARYYTFIPRYDHCPTGRLVLRIYNAPYGSRQQWADGKRQKLEDCLGRFIHGLRVAAQREKERRAERERWEREWQEKQRRREEQRRLARLEQLREEKLLRDVGRWARAGQIRQFVAQLEQVTPIAAGLAEWIAWAKAYVEKIDPLAHPESLAFNETAAEFDARPGQGDNRATNFEPREWYTSRWTDIISN